MATTTTDRTEVAATASSVCDIAPEGGVGSWEWVCHTHGTRSAWGPYETLGQARDDADGYTETECASLGNTQRDRLASPNRSL